MSCEEEQNAVEALRSEIASLQEDLKATAPQNKPKIIAEINGLQADLKAAKAALRICQRSQPAEPLRDVQPGKVRIRLDYLGCSKSYEAGWGQYEEPYLMVFPILLNVERIKASDFVLPQTASHGNVGYEYYEGSYRYIGDRFSAIVDAGTWPFYSGVLVFCFEEDFTPNASVRAAYKKVTAILNTWISGVVTKVLAGQVDLSKGIPQSDLDVVNAQVKDAIIDIYKRQPFNADDFVGVDGFFVQMASYSTRDVMMLRFEGDGSEYYATGLVAFDPA